MRLFPRCSMVGLLAALALGALQVRGDDTAARVPADALVYVQWKGGEATGSAYQNSHVKALVDAFGLPKLIEQYIQEKNGKETDPVKIADGQLAKELVEAALKGTTTLYVGPMDFANPELPVPKIAIFSNVGRDRAAQLAPKIRSLYERNKSDTDPPLTSLQVDDYLVVCIGSDVEVDKRLSGPVPTDGLASTDAFKATMAQLNPRAGAGENASLVYVNLETVIKMVDDYVATRPAQTGSSSWPMIEEALGITELKQLAFTGNFENQNWNGEAFIGMGEKRTGVLSLLDSGPMDVENYKLIPAAATWATLYRFDGMKLYDDARSFAAEAGPNGEKQFDMVMRQFFNFTGVDLKNDLLASMGDTYAMFETPDSAGRSCNAFNFVSKLKNGKKFETALSTLETVANSLLTQELGGTVPQFKTEPMNAPDDKITDHYLALETFTPNWAVSDGVLYISSTKAGLQSAIDNAGKNGAITDNATFKMLYRTLGQEQISSFSYIDFPRIAAEMMDDTTQLINEANELHPADATEYKLPEIPAVVQHLSPALRVTWSDASGWHLKSTGPFPLSGNVGPQNLILNYLMAKEGLHREAKKKAEAEKQGAGGAEKTVAP